MLVAHEAVDVDVRNGTSPMKYSPIMIIRATQKKMMSYPVIEQIASGSSAAGPRCLSGQPSVENGHSPDENQVSSDVLVLPQRSRRTARTPSASPRATIISPQASQYQAGMRCPHQSCREMHQSRMFSIQWK